MKPNNVFALHKRSTPTGLISYTNMADFSLFRYTNMADVTSRENVGVRISFHSVILRSEILTLNRPTLTALKSILK